MLLKGAAHKIKWLIASAALPASILFSVYGYAAMHSDDAATIKAAYVFNFSKLVSWPLDATASTDLPTRFCVFGDDRAVFKQLRAYAQQSVKNRSVTVSQYYSLQHASSCDVMYISQSEYRILGELLDTVREFPILTISDIPEFIALGGMLELRQLGSKMQFLVNRQCVERAGLGMGSELLALALNRLQAAELDCP